MALINVVRYYPKPIFFMIKIFSMHSSCRYSLNWKKWPFFKKGQKGQLKGRIWYVLWSSKLFSTKNYIKKYPSHTALMHEDFTTSCIWRKPELLHTSKFLWINDSNRTQTWSSSNFSKCWAKKINTCWEYLVKYLQIEQTVEKW